MLSPTESFHTMAKNSLGKAVFFSQKIEIFTKSTNFRKKSIFSQNIEIFTKNRNFHKKSKFSQTIEIFTKSKFSQKNRNFHKKTKFPQKNLGFFSVKKFMLKKTRSTPKISK